MAPEDNKTKDIQELGCRFIPISFDRRGINPLADIKLMLEFRKIIKREKPDVVLSYTIKPNLYGGMACQLCKIPQIANITGLGTAVENPGWLQNLTIFLYKLGLRKASTVFFQNKANKDFCEQHKMVNGKTKLIPGSGVNLLHHNIQTYPSQDEPVRFIFISRLLKEKGIDEYLNAACEIKLKYPNTEFHIWGQAKSHTKKKSSIFKKRAL